VLEAELQNVRVYVVLQNVRVYVVNSVMYLWAELVWQMIPYVREPGDVTSDFTKRSDLLISQITLESRIAQSV
jgi:hypothetical protein